MDYCLEATKVNIQINKDFREMLIERMEFESKFMTTCLEDFHIMLEDAGSTVKKTGESLWDKIKKFFAGIFGVFKSTSEKLFANNKEWLDTNYNKFDKIDYTNIKIEMLPFWWDPSLDKCKGIVSQIEQKLKNVATSKNNTKQYKDIKDLKEKLLKEYVDENGDLTNGLKNIYRVGNARGPLKTVNVEGNQLREQALHMRDYCFNYGKDVSTYISNLMRNAEKEIQVIEKMMTTAPTQPTKESFCLVENALYKDTELAYCDNFIVLEADENAQNTNKEGVKEKDGSTTNPTEVKVVNKENKNQQKEDNMKQQYNGQGYNELAFAKSVVQVYQLSITALMTVLEERFSAYIKALHHIIDEGGKDIDNNVNNGVKPTAVKVSRKGKVK